MKNAVLFFFLLIFGFLRAQVAFDDQELELIVEAERNVHALKTAGTASEATNNYDVKWYRCWWNVDPAVREISGSVTTWFESTSMALDSIAFDMHQNLNVYGVEMHGQTLTWNHREDVLTIYFPEPVAPGALDSVTVNYQGIPPENGWGTFVQATHGDVPIIWTLSEPYGASDWWPCKNGLTDKADSVDIFLSVPQPFTSASNGFLAEVMEGNVVRVFHWKHRYPIAAYLVCFAVTNYAVYSVDILSGGKPLQFVNYVYPEDSATVRSQTDAVIPMIHLFDSLFGNYPFRYEKYGQAQFGWGGGMEHQTCTFLGGFGYELMSHELAHQWFGDMVTCGSWTDIWLNEGFATYLSGLCYEFLQPEWWKVFREVRIKSIVSSPGGSVYCPDTNSVSRIFDGRLSYAKGAMILHQLRWLLGDSVFFGAVNNYLADAKVRFGFALTDDLKSHLENASGQDLSWYFNDWFTGEGYPEYNIHWWQTGNQVTFTVNQSQSHPSVSFFEMLIPVQFKNASHDTILRVFNTFDGQTFTAEIPFQVDSVVFDPDWQLISGKNTAGTVAESPENEVFRVSPNPVSGQLTLTCPRPVSGKVLIDLLNTRGEVVASLMHSAWPVEENQQTFTFSLPDGFYMIRIHENGRDHFRKLLIVNLK